MRSITRSHTISHRAYAMIATAEALIGGLAAIAKRISDRRGMRPLLSFDEHQLKDIGLSRADVEREYTKPIFWPIGG
jgi:uncharacterized protein YjiS (DUF1127 family)